MAELSDEAKALIKDSIRIVREDKQHKMLREIHARGEGSPAPTGQPKAGDPGPPSGAGNPDPPPPVPPKPEPKKKGLWTVGSED